MRTIHVATIGFVSLCLVFTNSALGESPKTCTTTERIQFPTTFNIPPSLSTDQAREALLVALGSADVDASWARDTFAGQWFYEYEDEDALYAGYSARSHYLRVAVILEENKVKTIVCDSRNLKQTERRIHRKVPGWKGSLDDNIRIALGQASAYYRNHPVDEEEGDLAEKLDNLESLRRSGVLTEKEYKELRQRVIDDYRLD